MKKVILPGLVAAMALSSVAHAELEVSGNVTTVTGYQHDDVDAGYGVGGITQGDLGIADAPNADHFRFLVDQVEIDLENEFGENIRARADIDFRDVANTALRAGDVIDLEQGYVTANLAVGNGMEFLVGKFNAPFGLETNDRNENVFSTYTPGYAFLNPQGLTGAKVYYEFNDNWSMDFGLVNSFNAGFANSAYPGIIARLGAMWGDEGNESYIHVGGGTSSEAPAGNSFTNWDYYGTAWGNFSIGDFWDLGWDYHYRQTGTDTALDRKAMAGQLYALYQISDVWTVQGRAAAHWEINDATAGAASTTGAFWNAANGTGFEGMLYSGTLGVTYQITDDANFKLEGRYDLADPAGAQAKADYITGVAELAYSF